MQHPAFLRQGSTIGITAPSSYVAAERVQYAKQVLEQWGYRVKTGNTIGSEHFYFSGTDEERLADLQALLDDEQVDAIMMGRGGYGMSRIIDRIDFTGFLQRPKWICGFSDIIVLQNHLQAKYGMPSLHSPMCGAFRPETVQTDYIRSVKKALAGEPLVYDINPSPYNRKGTAEGILTGGNLAILTHLTGSVSEVNTRGKILLIEDISEYLYRIDRMLLQLQRAGKLSGLKALLVGSFNEIEDTERGFGQTVEQIIWDKISRYDYPVCFNFRCGHEEVNYPVFLGMNYRLTVDGHGGRLQWLN